MYNNLIYFLVAIVVFSTAPDNTNPILPGWAVIFSTMALFFVFDTYIKRLFDSESSKSSNGYFQAEKQASIAALLGFGLLVYGLDIKYYLAVFSFENVAPALVAISGLLVFLFFLVLVWNRARLRYQLVFQRFHTRSSFIISNIRANLPIVIPWIVGMLCYDLLNAVPFPFARKFLESVWGDGVIFLTFLLFIFFCFPPLVRRLWGCKKIEHGPLFDHLQEFCCRQKFTADFYAWPLFEGRVITAGVMGVIPGMRYILLTPALIETMNNDELDSVVAHEIGHVKRFHLILYAFLLVAFSVVMGIVGEPLFYYFFNLDLFYVFVSKTGINPEMARTWVVAVFVLLLLILYFRFGFGFFMRNFERQADMYVFSAVGTCRSLISAFEKIAVLSGNTRDKPSWHHFGLGERIDFLKQCEKNKTHISRHNRKVWMSLALFTAICLAAVSLSRLFSYEKMIAESEEKFIKADLLYKAHREEYPAHWLYFAGNYYTENGFEDRALLSYELARQREPNQPDILNNYAWLLLTAEKRSLRNPEKALRLADKAVSLEPSGPILDTLATALWANGNVTGAARIAIKAERADPAFADYYIKRREKFMNEQYGEH